MGDDQSLNEANLEDSQSNGENRGIPVWLWVITIGLFLIMIVVVVWVLSGGTAPSEEIPLPTATQEPTEAITPTSTEEDEETPPDEPTEEPTEVPTEAPPSGFEFRFDFEENNEGWVAGFADLPADYEEEIFELDSEWRKMPDGLDGFGIYIQGHNRSDDLFMFIKRQVEGLNPDTNYNVIFNIDLATNIPEGMMGIGGSPGESVYVKAGSTVIEPDVIEDDQGWLRMNIDKGNQATEGEDMINLGNIAYPVEEGEEPTGEYKIKLLDNEGQTFNISTDGTGTLWFIVGTDSGFEGLTALYYATITITIVEAGGIN
jgi:hypothetical protein